MIITESMLIETLGCNEVLAKRHRANLDKIATTAGIDTPDRISAFLAVVMVATNNLYSLAELWGPKPLIYQKQSEVPYHDGYFRGNDEYGDGYRYRHRGYLPVEGKNEYEIIDKSYHEDLNGDPKLSFIETPEALEMPYMAVPIGIMLWFIKDCKRLIDHNDYHGFCNEVMFTPRMRMASLIPYNKMRARYCMEPYVPKESHHW